MSQTIPGASVWEQQLYDHLVSHVDGELETLKAYEKLAQSTESEAFRYLAGLILEDERRHHKMLDQLAQSIRTSAELSTEPTPVPPLDLRLDRERILALTEQFIAVEEEDDKELKRLGKELKDVRHTTLWKLVLDIIQADNEKHRRILGFIRDRAKEH
jgi:rubrerythrin